MIRAFRLALSCAALTFGASGVAQAADALKSVQLSKVILNTDSEVKGKLKVGTICLFGGGPITLTKEQKTQDYEHYDNLFSGRLKDRYFNVVTTSSDLFGEETAKKGDYLVGATLRLETINMCSSVNGEKGDVTLRVEWKIFDRAAQTVVATVDTTGQGKQEKFAQDGFKGMMDRAFQANLDALIDQGALQKHLGEPAK